MSYWTTRRLLMTLADMLTNALATRRPGDGEPVRLILSPELAEKLAAAAEDAAERLEATDAEKEETP